MKDYIKQIWQNRGIILEGIKNRLFARGKVKRIAEKRLAVCNVCQYNSSNSAKSSYKVPFKHCTLCGCSLNIKPYAMESECPKKFWYSRKLD